MNIAIVGTRGIPANYGGFETFAEELSTRLVEGGHQVTVYGRSNNVRHAHRLYRGVQLVVLPTISTKHLDTVTHTFLSVFHALVADYDVILMCNAANAIFSIVPRLGGIPIALNVDGIERKRGKWGVAGRTYYKISEYLATLLPNVVVTDAAVMEDYFLERQPYALGDDRLRSGLPPGREHGIHRGPWSSEPELPALRESTGAGKQCASGDRSLPERGHSHAAGHRR